MARQSVVDVGPDAQSWWQVFRGAYLLSAHASKAEAVEEDTQLAAEIRPSRLVVHTKDGQVETTATYDDDPAACV